MQVPGASARAQPFRPSATVLYTGADASSASSIARGLFGGTPRTNDARAVSTASAVITAGISTVSRRDAIAQTCLVAAHGKAPYNHAGRHVTCCSVPLTARRALQFYVETCSRGWGSQWGPPSSLSATTSSTRPSRPAHRRATIGRSVVLLTSPAKMLAARTSRLVWARTLMRLA